MIHFYSAQIYVAAKTVYCQYHFGNTILQGSTMIGHCKRYKIEEKIYHKFCITLLVDSLVHTLRFVKLTKFSSFVFCASCESNHRHSIDGPFQKVVLLNSTRGTRKQKCSSSCGNAKGFLRLRLVTV